MNYPLVTGHECLAWAYRRQGLRDRDTASRNRRQYCYMPPVATGCPGGKARKRIIARGSAGALEPGTAGASPSVPGSDDVC
jgi:hypothetical protein